MAHPDEPTFRADGALFAPRFGDVYSQADGLAEARHVFLGGNALPERLRTARRIVVGETGFGTGSNFLATWALFRAVAPADARLCFVSVEAFPLAAATMRRALARFPELDALAALLVAGHDERARGFVRRSFDGGRVTLCLLIGDAAKMLAAHRFRADAWFLDGFAPARNPEMWSAAVLGAVARSTKAGGTCATFTVAGDVRRALAAAGFSVEKRRGFGQKREMTVGVLATPTTDAAPAWLRLPEPTHPARVTVIGAGLAGSGAARALAERGVEVTVVDRQGVAAGASGHALAVLQPRLGPTPDARFVAAAFRWTRARLDEVDPERRVHVPCGVLQPALDAATCAALRRRIAAGAHAPDEATFVDGQGCDDRAGVTLGALGGAWLASSAAVRPALLCARLLDHPRIELVRGDATPPADARVLAHALGARGAAETAFLPLRAVRGQLSVLAAGPCAPPRCVLSDGRYLTPEIDGVRAVGATFQRDDEDLAPRDADDRENLERARAAFPALAGALAVERLSPSVGVRAATVDRLPFVGPLPDVDAFERAYAAIWRGARDPDPPPPVFRAGAFASLGHGSRGVATGPFAGELIAAMLCGEPPGIEEALLVRVLPARALARRGR